MNPTGVLHATSLGIQRVYLLLLLLHTLAASFIWGINTLFLLDAGLSNAEAFGANAFFTAGMVVFEVPTGVVADTRGRRMSYLLGTITLAASTLLYLAMWYSSAAFWAWALASALLGLGFTFFSGAVQAWLTDALTFTGYFRDGGRLETVLAKGEIVEGVAMLGGSVAGGLIAQVTNLGVPYLLRTVVLLITFGLAFALMRDVGFTPARGKRVTEEVRSILRGSIAHGLGNRPVRWLMLEAPFTGGVTIYAFYAMQPYLLQLYENERAYAIAGLAAAIVAGAQIAGGLLVPYLGRIFGRRTSVLLAGTMLGTAASGCHWPGSPLLDRDRASGPVGSGVRGGDAGPAGVLERPHRIQRARDRAVVRLAAGIVRRRRCAADLGQGRGCLGVSTLLPMQRRHSDAVDSIPVAGSPREHGRRFACGDITAHVTSSLVSRLETITNLFKNSSHHARRRPRTGWPRTSSARSPRPGMARCGSPRRRA